MKTTRIEKQVTINADKQRVWEVLSDFGNVYKVSPNISKSYLTCDADLTGKGMTRHCDFVMMGASVEERIVDWREGEYIKIDIYERNKIPMIAKMMAEFKVEANGESTDLTGIMEYGISNPIGNILNGLAMKKSNEKVWGEFLAGFKHYLETGEEVDKETKLDTSVVREPVGA